MKMTYSPLTVEDFGLTEDELKTLVTGAQTHLAPADDDLDNEPFIGIS